MTDRKRAGPVFWAVCVLAIMWNLIGINDYYHSVTLDTEYLSLYPGMIEFVEAMPAWATGAWGLGVTTALLGSICLLFRKAWAYPLYAIAIVGMVFAFGYQFTANNEPDLPSSAHFITVLVWAIAFFLLWYARKKKSDGTLT